MIKKTIQLRDKDKWVLDEIEHLVATKKAMGLKTSFNFEIARILKRGLTGEK